MPRRTSVAILPIFWRRSCSAAPCAGGGHAGSRLAASSKLATVAAARRCTIVNMGTMHRVFIALSAWCGVVNAQPSKSVVKVDCWGAVSNMLKLSGAENTPGMDADKLRALPSLLRERCFVDKWDVAAMKCMVYAKNSADLKACVARLTPTQLEALGTSVTASTSAIKIDGGVDGWKALVAASPFETDPSDLCGPINARTANQAQVNLDALASCNKALEDQAFNFQTRIHARPECEPCRELATLIDGRVTQCLTAVQATPYNYVSFDPNKACAAYDQYIEFGEVALKSRDYQAGDRGGDRLRSDLAANRKQKTGCLRHANAALKASRDSRDAAAPTADLAVLRNIPPGLRTSAESARMTSEINACKAEAARRREERLKGAATRDISELRAIDAQHRLPEEEARIAQADAEPPARVVQGRSPVVPAGKVKKGASPKPTKPSRQEPAFDATKTCIKAAQLFIKMTKQCGLNAERPEDEPPASAYCIDPWVGGPLLVKLVTKGTCADVEDFWMDRPSRL